MRRIALAVMGTITAVVALFSYHTSTNSGISASGDPPVTSGADPGTSGSTGDAGSSDTPPASAGSSPTGTASGSRSSSASGTYTGSAADTRWGVVQVEITVKDGRITQSQAVQYPDQNPRDAQINSYALPQLASEVLQKQSASIDAISGATVTSDGYIQSLQSAVDQAHL